MKEKQSELGLRVENNVSSIEEYKFEPIKGYPMLHWKGKRPFTSTHYYPAQLKENYGEPVNGWMNRLYWGDNLQVMSHILRQFRGMIDLVYIDPPFDSKATYKKIIKLKGKEISGDINSFEEKQYDDIWSNDEYLQFMYERIILLRELLAETGSIVLHCDWHKVHHLRCIMDEVFGNRSFRNEIIWGYYGPGSPGMRQFNRKHDNLLWYTKSDNWKFNDSAIRISHDEKTIENFKEGLRGSGFIGDNYEIPEGKIPEDHWIMAIAARYPNDGVKRVGYPTEKPFPLIERIISACTYPGDLVFDCFMGSGVCQSSSLKLGRRFLGADINLGSVQITTKRLLTLKSKLDEKVNSNATEKQLSIAAEDEPDRQMLRYTGFSVYNVNHYDFFRNPVQAKDILIQALEIQPLSGNTVYDGEKDGRLVKIMSINRIATRADLNELITSFNFKDFEKKQENNPGKPVESLLLVCMGHEPDLAASLQNAVPYKLDIEVVDILRDKSNLEFKRDSEAEIKVINGYLTIKQFYPMNLLQKLSLMKKDVNEWRELVESVMVDFNYDGSVFEPTVVDVPEKDEMVSGRYEVPYSCGTIRVKITDLLSESLEMEVPYVR